MLSSLLSWWRRDHDCDDRSKTSYCAYNRKKPPDFENGDAPSPSMTDAPAPLHSPSVPSFSPDDAPAVAPSVSFDPPQEPPFSDPSTQPPLMTISLPPFNELSPVVEEPPLLIQPPLPLHPTPSFVHSPPPRPAVHTDPEVQQNIAIAVIAGMSSGGGALLLGLLCFVIVYLSRKCRRKYKSLVIQKPKGNGLNHHQHQFIQNGYPQPPYAHPILMVRKYTPGVEFSSGNCDAHPDNENSGCSTPSLRTSRCIFSYEELNVATNSFSEDNLLGEGGFGFVHKGVLSNGTEVAVKQLKIGSRQGEREFYAEVETITRVHHKHLVSLVGYCLRGCQRLLVYEFVPNNTLQFHLHGVGRPIMKWSTRMKIAIGAAKGLAYLHEDCHPTIIHRDIKPSNILLDFNFEAKVSDFGLAKFFTDGDTNVTHVSTRVVGTFGYLAPEYAISGQVTDKSDVFSYGVMLLELITGRSPIETTETLSSRSLVEWARPLLAPAMEERNLDALVDPKLKKNYKSDEMTAMIVCAAACVRHSAWLRPRMSQIVRALDGDLSLTLLHEGLKPGNSRLCNHNVKSTTLSRLFDMTWDSDEFRSG